MTGTASRIDGMIFTIASLSSGWASKGLGSVCGSSANLSDSLPLGTATFKRGNDVSHLASSGQSVCKTTNCTKADNSHEFPGAIPMLNSILVRVTVYRVIHSGAIQPSMVGLAKFRFHRLLRRVGRKYTCSHRWGVLSGTCVVALGAVLTDSARRSLEIGEA
jgi:hypothetical protein